MGEWNLLTLELIQIAKKVSVTSSGDQPATLRLDRGISSVVERWIPDPAVGVLKA